MLDILTSKISNVKKPAKILLVNTTANRTGCL